MRARQADQAAVLCLLHLAESHGIRLQRTNLTKIVFKSELEIAAPTYRFYRHTYGPFSTTLHRDVESLNEVGFMQGEGLTDRGGEVAKYLYKNLVKGRQWGQALMTLEASLMFLGPMTAAAASRWSHELVITPVGASAPQRLHDIKLGTDLVAPRRLAGWDPLPMPSDVTESLEYAMSLTAEDLERMRALDRTSLEALLG